MLESTVHTGHGPHTEDHRCSHCRTPQAALELATSQVRNSPRDVRTTSAPLRHGPAVAHLHPNFRVLLVLFRLPSALWRQAPQRTHVFAILITSPRLGVHSARSA